jgi:hypothetical protein
VHLQALDSELSTRRVSSEGKAGSSSDSDSKTHADAAVSCLSAMTDGLKHYNGQLKAEVGIRLHSVPLPEPATTPVAELPLAQWQAQLQGLEPYLIGDKAKATQADVQEVLAALHVRLQSATLHLQNHMASADTAPAKLTEAMKYLLCPDEKESLERAAHWIVKLGKKTSFGYKEITDRLEKIVDTLEMFIPGPDSDNTLWCKNKNNPAQGLAVSISPTNIIFRSDMGAQAQQSTIRYQLRMADFVTQTMALQARLEMGDLPFEAQVKSIIQKLAAFLLEIPKEALI